MGDTGGTIRLYTSQADAVLQAIQRDGVCFSKEEYVRRKYEESAPIFLTAYRWYAGEAQKLAPKPQGAEFPYWAFRDLYSLDQGGESHTLALDVPLDQAVLFDLYDWNKIICLKYIGQTEQEETAFRQMLAQSGTSEHQVMLSNFYPQWKREITASWGRLFRHNDRLKAGDAAGVGGVQAGLWQIKAEWIVQRQRPF